jgi:hypothetical protein
VAFRLQGLAGIRHWQYSIREAQRGEKLSCGG